MVNWSPIRSRHATFWIFCYSICYSRGIYLITQTRDRLFDSRSPFRDPLVVDITYPVAAGDTFFSSSLIGALSAALMNALPIWRNRACAHGVTDLRDRLAQAQCIHIVFPEGSRSRSGEINRFRAGVGMVVAGSSVPVVPCSLSGTFQALPPGRRIPRPIKIRLTIGTPLLFDNQTNDRGGWDHVASAIESSVRKLSKPAET
jgi:hypothetical protein